MAACAAFGPGGCLTCDRRQAYVGITRGSHRYTGLYGTPTYQIGSRLVVTVLYTVVVSLWFEILRFLNFDLGSE